MTTTILLAPAATGKTEAALRTLSAPRHGQALLLLPSALHITRLRERLDALPRVRALTLSGLAHLVLRQAGAPPEEAPPAVGLAILRAELRSLAAAGRLPTLGAVATRAGVVIETLRLIEELRGAEIAPTALAAAGVSPYDADLATAYEAYTTALAHHNLVDANGLLARARDLLIDGTVPLHFDLLVADGFDQLTPLQRSLLRALTNCARHTLITLTGDGTGRTAHSRFARTLDELRATLPDATLQALDAGGTAWLSPPLLHLERGLFELEPPTPVEAEGAIAVISAPDREREVRAALRLVLQHIAAGTPAHEIAILYRTGTLYEPLLREVAAEYRLPVAFFTGRSLGEAPPVVALQALLALPLELAEGPNQPDARRLLVACWRGLGTLSPARLVQDPSDPTREQPDTPGITTTAPQPAGDALPDLATAAALLDRATRRAGPLRGLPRLRAALTALANAEAPIADDEPGGPGAGPDEAAALLALLDTFLAWLNPPSEAPPDIYAAWLQGLLWPEGEQTTDNQAATIEPGASVVAPTDDGAAERTLSALFPFTGEQRARLRQLLAERTRIARLLNEPPQPYSAFVAELRAACDAAYYGGEEPGAGKVAILPLLAARGQAFAHIVIPGAADGELPARLSASPFYTRRERSLLAARGAAPPPPDPGDERAIFYEAVARARRSLTLTYTRLDESGNPLEPSPYVRALTELFTPGSVPVTRILAGSAPDTAEAASPQEAMIAAAAADPLLSDLPPTVPATLAAHVRRAAAVERQRESAAPHGPHEGVLDDPTVIAAIARHFGPDHRWSVTQINDYTTCAFRFAAAHLLRLTPLDSLDEGLEQVGRGRLAHAILARAGAQWAHLEPPFDADNERAVLAALSAAADDVLATAPQTYGFEPGPFWPWEQDEVRAALAHTISRTLREAGWAGFKPAGVEERFGLGRGLGPLRVQTPAGEALVAGRIDRVDQDEVGRLALIDYKSGSSHRSLEETLDGRDVQLTVYTLAAEQLGRPGQQVVQAAYLTLGNGKLSRPLTPAERERAEAALRERLGAAVAGSRSGQFAVRPSGDCPRGCAFATICRLKRKG